jgi:hypothetical protein
MTIMLALLASVGAGLDLFSQDVTQAQAQSTRPQAAVGTAFTYQGQLTDDQGNPLTGSYDFEFELYDGSGSGANQVGSAITVSGKQVDNGLFAVQLDFGSSAFNGDERWLEIHVRDAGSGSGYATLTPRQALSPAPYAIGLMPGASINGALNNGGALNLANSANDGLRVNNAGDDGVQVSSANYGFYVQNATVDGLLIDSAGNDGVYVGRAESDGVYVASANYGVSVASSDTDGIFVNNADADGDGVGIAGYFDGDVRVTDHFTATNLYAVFKNFVIDHPLDPENKYLYHSSVESPDRMNVYNGNVTLDENGEVWVQLPDYFEALNRDFRYQLTPIGGPGPNLYVTEEIQDNRFKIAGGEPGLKVSWQVTGVRDDASAQTNPMRVEVDKPERKKGFYLDPEAYGQPASQGIDRVGRGVDK